MSLLQILTPFEKHYLNLLPVLRRGTGGHVTVLKAHCHGVKRQQAVPGMPDGLKDCFKVNVNYLSHIRGMFGHLYLLSAAKQISLSWLLTVQTALESFL
jgi:hypothetical protein